MTSPWSRIAVPLRRLLSVRPPLRPLSTAAANPEPHHDSSESSSKDSANGDDAIFVKGPSAMGSATRDGTSVTMPMSFMTGSIVGKRFYKDVTTRLADDGNGWTVMLDYRTLKTPSKRSLKLPTPALAKAIAAEWGYQQEDGIRPFTMPLMKLACTALERVPLTRVKVIENLMKKFHQDLLFYRAPGDNDLTSRVLEKQVEKFEPILDWVETEFGVKPIVHSSFFGVKQEDCLVKVIEDALKRTTDCELAAIDAMAATAHSLIISLGIFHGRLGIEEAIELIRLEEDLQVDRWGLVEGGHDVDIADLQSKLPCLGLCLSRYSQSPEVFGSTPIEETRNQHFHNVEWWPSSFKVLIHEGQFVNQADATRPSLLRATTLFFSRTDLMFRSHSEVQK